MAIRCPQCGREYDVTLFSFGSTLRCECGARVSALEPHRSPPPPDGAAERVSRRGMDEIARGADRIASLILHCDLPEIDIELAIGRLRERTEELFPGRGELFGMVYEARFRRLREQWGTQRRRGW